MAATGLDAFKGCGAAFFPEQQPRATWPEYVARLAEAGIQFVRLGEFAWDKLEVREGEFNWEWLDTVLELLARHNIQALLCTPTAVPPIWACETYPEIHPVQRDGKTFGFGVRRYTCPTSPAYHRLSEGVAAALAEHYGPSAQIIGWQIDNEFGHPFCFCPRCLRAFRGWCEQRFGTIARFNDALETHFLGQTLQHFDQVPFPTSYPSPSLWINYHRFFSAVTIACFAGQVRCLRIHGARQPVTSNMMPTWYGYDHEEMARHFDVVAGDHYFLGNIFGSDFAGEAFVSAYLRGMKQGAPIWLHETQCAATGAGLPVPGQVRCSTLTQVGLGANLINYFRWDTCPSGMERDQLGLLKPSLQPGRFFAEVQGVTAELKAVQGLLDHTAATPARIAILFTCENHWEFAEYPKHDDFQGPHGNGYSLHLARHFRAIADRNIPVDVVYPGADFSRYALIIAPALYILPTALAAKLTAFAEQGGTLLLTSFCGVADENAKLWATPVPGPLREAAGLRVLEYGKYHAAMGDLRLVGCVPAWPLPELALRSWVDEVRPDPGTEVLAVYGGTSPIQGPVFTRKRHGGGTVYYLGTLLAKDDYGAFYEVFLRLLGFTPVMELPPGVHAAVRDGEGGRVSVLRNDTALPQELRLHGPCTDAVTGTALGAMLPLPPFGARLVATLSRT